MLFNSNNLTCFFSSFNDDFFIMEKIDKPRNYYRGYLYKRIVQLEDKTGITQYSQLLRDCVKECESLGVTTKDFSLHIPLKINRINMLCLRNMTDFEGFRSLYGNVYTNTKYKMNDCKITSLTKEHKGGCYLSTDERSFESGIVGKQIRAKFQDKCEYEL